MLMPLRDENPLVHKPMATICLIGANLLAWALLQGFGSPEGVGSSVCSFGFIPADVFNTEYVTPPVCPSEESLGFATLFSSMFMHAGWLHLLGNMWFLWIFGDNVEDAMGPGRFVVFYLLCGLAAAGAQALSDLSSNIPMVGASGAVGGVMGAYALLYPRARILSLFIFFTVSIPAFVMLGYWVLIQVLGSLQPSTGGGVAFWAHIGGFVAGLALILVFRRNDFVQEHLAQPRRDTARYHPFDSIEQEQP